MKKTKTIKFCDLFAGIGGFRYGFEKASKIQSFQNTESGSDNKSRTPQHGGCAFRCVWSNEWDKYAASIYRYHFGEIDTRDIRTIDASEIPDHDLLCAGFPCQSFSFAGKRRGFEDTRGTLFFEIARIAKHKRPRYLLLENVKGLLSHDQGKTFQTILGVLTDLGYRVEWEVLNSKHFGVPQNRERVFIVGHLRETSRPEVFPIGEGGETDFSGVGIIDGFNRKRSKEIGVAQRAPLKFLKRNQKNIEGDYSFTVDGANIGGVRQDMKIRRLTSLECERLQGFPDCWTAKGVDENGNEAAISDTQRYKVLGNAVTTNVIAAIGRELLNVKRKDDGS